MKGIDVSSYQGNINFVKVRASGVEIVYIKATEGIAYINPNLITYYNNAKLTGIKVGFYHFLRTNNPISEAEYFLSALEGLTPECRYAIDIELALNQSVSTINSNVRKFADYLISKGKDVVIYTGDYFYRDILNSTVKDLPLWVANYGTETIASTYVGWQYSGTGSVRGISGNVDLDTFYNGILIQGVKTVESIVIYTNSIDQVYADKLADYLKCPTINGDRPYDYSNIKNVYWVGRVGKLGVTSYVTVRLTGADRYATLALVDAFIADGGK
jgi:lysozyme